jgi:hypothetical protein
VSGADAVAPFYRVGGGAGRPGVGEEWVAVVRHNGDEGGCFRRGSVGVVLGSDEGWGVLWPLRERKRHARTRGNDSISWPREEDERVRLACQPGMERARAA